MEENPHSNTFRPPLDKKGSEATPLGKKGSEATPLGKKGSEATPLGKKGSEATPLDKKGSEATPSGGLIHLRTRLTEMTTWLGPAWACLCGVVASGSFGWQDGVLSANRGLSSKGGDFLRLALLILLVDGGWGTLWAALGSTDWATPLRRWRNWQSGEPSAALPYTLPNSPGDQASRWLGQLRVWWRDALWPTCGPAISSVVVALPVTILLGILLGPELLLLSAAALAVAQLGLAWEGGRGATAPGWNAIVAVALPWLAGHIAFGGSPTLRSIGLAMTFALAWGSTWRFKSAGGRTLGVGAQLLAAALLIALYQPLAAGFLLLLLAPQLVLLPWLWRGQSASWYVRHARPWLMAAMMIAAWAL
jgi:hypothetical protein